MLREVEERRRKLQWLPATKFGLIDALAPDNGADVDASQMDDDALWDMVDDALKEDHRRTPLTSHRSVSGQIIPSQVRLA